ncbi:MAG: hypothetical protein HGA22_01045 [Clostridiales bacterium]|nr:hypothetical protein [Clostridiales bacterium]
MNHAIKENIKSILIIMLIISSIAQVGILWSDSSHGLPTGILSAIFGSHEVSVNSETASKDLFVPYRMVLSDGDTIHWVVDADSRDFENLWKEGKDCLSGIIMGKYSKMDSDADWGSISTRMGVTFAFKTAVSAELLKWYFGKADSDTEIPDLYRLKIITGSTGNSSTEIYLYSGEGLPVRYRAESFKESVGLQELITSYENADEDSRRLYSNMKDNNQDQSLNAEPDVLIVTRSVNYWAYSNVRSELPAIISQPNPDTAAISTGLLDTDKDRYVVNTYDDGTIQFNDTTNNIYKIFKDGLLEYKYRQITGSSDKGSVGEALLNAYRFINVGNSIIENPANVKLLLTAVDTSADGYYTFRFGYYVDGNPVVVSLASAGSGGQAENAIEINASSKRVLKCRWVLRKFTIEGQSLYYDRFMEIMPKTEDSNIMKIKDVSVGYELTSLNTTIMKPSLVIDKEKSGDNTHKTQIVALPEK